MRHRFVTQDFAPELRDMASAALDAAAREARSQS